MMLKRILNWSFGYALLAMAGGVFYREFTKFSAFEGRTTLAFVHTHLFLLGMIMLLIVVCCVKLFHIQDAKKFKAFFLIYNAGVILTSIMFVIRGIFQVNQTILNTMENAMISGFAGIGHILTGVGIILFFLIMKECVRHE